MQHTTDTTASHLNSGTAATPARRERPSSTIASAILGASAFVLAGLTLMQAGRMTSTAHANESANSGSLGYSVATIRSGNGPDTRTHDLLYIIDSRGETLFIYFIENVAERRVLLRQVVSLPQLFRTARGG
ncbi:MAG: hypothetical protein KF724_00145 [Phycisphaeraceae bacterium]|nr:hypothetical protein [Phycisphaeraceae bacterium]